jgi:hypothetical protein
MKTTHERMTEFYQQEKALYPDTSERFAVIDGTGQVVCIIPATSEEQALDVAKKRNDHSVKMERFVRSQSGGPGFALELFEERQRQYDQWKAQRVSEPPAPPRITTP